MGCTFEYYPIDGIFAERCIYCLLTLNLVLVIRHQDGRDLVVAPVVPAKLIITHYSLLITHCFMLSLPYETTIDNL